MYTYSLIDWLLLFYAYCFFGWCFESAYVSYLERRFVNRGFIRGPMLPLYGTGAVLILHVALPLKGQPVAMFFSGLLAATVLEYVTGWAMESLFKVKYWDYSEHKFQFQGRICLQSSLAWGALSLLLVYVIHPPIAALALSLPPLAALIATLLVSALFAVDLGYAFRTALDLARVLEELTRLREQIGDVRAELSEAAQETRERLSEAAQETRERLSEAAQETRERLSEAAQETREQLAGAAQEARARLESRLEELTARYENRISAIGRTRRSLVRGNPSAVSKKFEEALQELKARYDRRKD